MWYNSHDKFSLNILLFFFFQWANISSCGFFFSPPCPTIIVLVCVRGETLTLSSSSRASPVKYSTALGTILSRKKWPISKSVARVNSESSSYKTGRQRNHFHTAYKSDRLMLEADAVKWVAILFRRSYIVLTISPSGEAVNGKEGHTQLKHRTPQHWFYNDYSTQLKGMM